MFYKRGGKTPKKFPKNYLDDDDDDEAVVRTNINQQLPQPLQREVEELMTNNPDDFNSDDSDDGEKYRRRKKKTKGKKKKYKRSKSIKKTKGKKKKTKGKKKKCKRNKSMKINLGRMSNKKLNQLKQRIINILNESKLKELFNKLKKSDKRFKNISLPKKLPSIRNYINKLKISDIKKNIKFFSNNAGNGDEDTCSICFGSIVSNNKTTTRCNHSFCKDCLREWMIQPIARNKCPNCRQPALNREQRRSMGLPIAPSGNTRQRITRIRNEDGSITEIRPYTSPIVRNYNTYIFSMVFSYLYFVLNMEHFACVVFAFFIMRYIANMLSPGSFD